MSCSRCSRIAVAGWLVLSIARPAGAAESLAHTARELESAAAQAQPGDVVLLAAGEWRDVDLVIEARGAAGRPITFAAERPGETVITGRSRLRMAGEHLVVTGLHFERAFHPDAVLEFRRDSRRLASHCRVTECAFVDCNPPEETTEDAKYVSIYGRDNRFDHCALSGKRTRGTTLVVWLTRDDSGAHQLDHNHFGPRPELKRNGGETIRMGDSQTSLQNARCVVEENLFEQCSGEAEIISNKSCENVYRHNTFRGCGGALTLRHGHRCSVEGNWFFGEGQKGTGGVRVIGSGHRVVNNHCEDLSGEDGRAALCLMTGIENSPLNGYAPVVDCVIAHNTLIDCRQPLLIGLGDEDVRATVAPRNCVIANNLIAGRRGPLVVVRDQPLGSRGGGNLTFGAAADWPAGVTGSSADPGLGMSPDGWSRPAAESPVRRVATSADGVDGDIEGQPRTAKRDIGCDQLAGDPARFRPLTRDDVGPVWRRTQVK